MGGVDYHSGTHLPVSSDHFTHVPFASLRSSRDVPVIRTRLFTRDIFEGPASSPPTALSFVSLWI